MPINRNGGTSGAVPWAGARVVKASVELSSGQKLLWLELHGLDHGPDRAFVSAARLAERLGMGLDNVEKGRRQLRAIGLLGSGPRPGGRGPTWWPLLPHGCLPGGRQPTDADVQRSARALDDWIHGQRDQSEADHSTPSGHSTVKRRGVPQYASGPPSKGVLESASPVAAEADPSPPEGGGKRGEGAASNLPETYEHTSPSSAQVREDGREDGVFARERNEEGTVATSASANWREFLTPPAPRSDQK